jgi:hypothetical protein
VEQNDEPGGQRTRELRMGHIGKAAGQLKTKADPKILFIGGEYQVWVPGLVANNIRRIALLPYLKPNSPFNAR